eukprot:1523915-Rhodomonas_salina.3
MIQEPNDSLRASWRWRLPSRHRLSWRLVSAQSLALTLTKATVGRAASRQTPRKGSDKDQQFLAPDDDDSGLLTSQASSCPYQSQRSELSLAAQVVAQTA